MLFGRFVNRNRKWLFVAMLFLLPLVPLALVRISLPRLNLYDRLSALVVHPAAELLTNVSGGLGLLWNRYLNLVHTQQSNEQLLREIDQLKVRIGQLEEFHRENERLQSLLSIPLPEKFSRIAARIIGQDSNPESISFVINVGQGQGVQPRMPVVSSLGVVGRVSEVFSHSSRVVSIVDPSHDVDGIIARSRARFIVEGRGKPLIARLKYLDRSEDVRVGDQVLTSGLDNVYPKGWPIGNVVRVERQRTGVSQEAEVRPLVDIGRLEEVVVLMSPASEASLESPEQVEGQAR